MVYLIRRGYRERKKVFNYVIIAAVLIIPFMYSFFYLKPIGIHMVKETLITYQLPLLIMMRVITEKKLLLISKTLKN